MVAVDLYQYKQESNQCCLQLFLYKNTMKQKFLKKPSKSHVCMKISTWSKDSHGLYDYESSTDSYREQTFYIDLSTAIFRDTNSPITILQHEATMRPVRNTFENIGRISIERKEKNSVFKFQPTLQKTGETNYDPARSFYRVLRQSNPEADTSNGFALKPGNIVKMGRIQYMVIEMKNNKQKLTIRDTNHFSETKGVFEMEVKPKNDQKDQQNDKDENGVEIRCKVCLCSEQTDEDPLISPCLCKGSVAKIHVGCLKQWINSKVKKQINDIALSYNFTKFECQICKTPFPQIIKVQQKQIQMMTIQKPNKPYIILESLNRNLGDISKEERCLHLISAKQNHAISIGRGHQCQIRLTDISVSRSHAQILFKDNQFFIKDKKSKFGTLIKLDQSIPMKSDQIIKVQYGRSLYEMTLEPENEVDTE